MIPDLQWFMAFIMPPTVLVIIGYVAMILHERSLRKSSKDVKKPN